MTLDEQIQESLAKAAGVHEPPAPPTDQLFAKVRHRQRAKLMTTGLGAASALLLVVAVAALLPGRSTPNEALYVAGQPFDPASGSAAPAAGDGPPVGSEAPTTSFGFPTPSTSIPHSTIAPTGTAHASPASVVEPSSSTSAFVSTTTTAPPPPVGDTVTVTQDDNGKTFTLHSGRHLVVSLSDESWEWSDPDTDNAEVLLRTAVSANPSSTHVTASFDAATAGQAHVSASKDAPCRRSEPPCMVPTMLWQITVNVI